MVKRKIVTNIDLSVESILRKCVSDKIRKKLFSQIYENPCPICKRNYICLDVHHKDGNWKNNRMVNLIPICPKCHSKIHILSRQSKTNLKTILREALLDNKYYIK